MKARAPFRNSEESRNIAKVSLSCPGRSFGIDVRVKECNPEQLPAIHGNTLKVSFSSRARINRKLLRTLSKFEKLQGNTIFLG